MTILGTLIILFLDYWLLAAFVIIFSALIIGIPYRRQISDWLDRWLEEW